MLQKGFLRKPHLFSSRLVFAGLATGVAYAIVFYTFLICVREIFRLQTFNIHSGLLILSPFEIFYYNFFSAFIACLTGASQAIDFIIKNNYSLPRRIKYTVYNNFTGLQWFSNHIFFKLGIFLAVFSWSSSFYKNLDLFRDIWFLFPLLLVVLLLNQWQKIHFLLPRPSFWWMARITFLYIVLSIALTFLPIIDYAALNESKLSLIPSHHLRIDYPQAKMVMKDTRISQVIDVYFGYPKKGNTDWAVIMFPYETKALSKTDFSAHFEESEFPQSRDYPVVHLHIDKNMELKEVNTILNTLAGVNRRKVKFITDIDGIGLPFIIPPRCATSDGAPLPVAIDCDSVENIVNSESTVVVRLTFSNQDLFVNKKQASRDTLVRYLTKRIREVDYNIMYALDVHETHYGDLIKILDIIYEAYSHVWNEESLKASGQPFIFADNYRDDVQQNTMRRAFPRIIFVRNSNNWTKCGKTIDSLSHQVIYTSADTQADVMGGFRNLWTKISKLAFAKNTETGQVNLIIYVVVDETGTVSHVRTSDKNQSTALNKELLALFQTFRWKPATCNGKNVTSQLLLRVVS